MGLFKGKKRQFDHNYFKEHHFNGLEREQVYFLQRRSSAMMQQGCNKLPNVEDPLCLQSSAGVSQHLVSAARLSWKLISLPCEGATLEK